MDINKQQNIHQQLNTLISTVTSKIKEILVLKPFITEKFQAYRIIFRYKYQRIQCNLSKAETNKTIKEIL